MPDQAPSSTPATTAGVDSAPAGESTPATPPWGSPEEFNPEKAWALIQNLRADVAKGKGSEVEALQAKVREYEDAQLTAEQKAARDLAEARENSETLGLENARLKAAIEHGLSAEDIELIGGSSPEEISEKAAKLAARLGSGTPKSPQSAPQGGPPRGGGDPTVPVEPTDWLRAALAKKD